MALGANNISAFVPEVWSKKLALVEKVMTSFANDFTNREWEGNL